MATPMTAPKIPKPETSTADFPMNPATPLEDPVLDSPTLALEHKTKTLPACNRCKEFRTITASATLVPVMADPDPAAPLRSTTDKFDPSSRPSSNKTSNSTNTSFTTDTNTNKACSTPSETIDPTTAVKKEAEERERIAWAARFDAKQQGGKGMSVNDEAYQMIMHDWRDQEKLKDLEKQGAYVCEGFAVKNPGDEEKKKKKGVMGMVSKMSKILKV